MYSRESNGAAGRDPQCEAYSTVLPDGGGLLTESAPAFIAETRHQAPDMVIARFRAALKGIQNSELERLYIRLPGLDEHSRLAIHQFADCLVEKMLQPPLESLRDESRHGLPHRLSDSLQRLFRLID